MEFVRRPETVVRYRLGELFFEAGIISRDVLTQGLTISKRVAMPIGRILIMSGHVSDLDVECAIAAQASLRDGSLDNDLAKELLRFSHVHQVTIEEAFKLNGISRGLGTLPRLGKLALAGGLVSEQGLADAIAHSESSGYPLGKSLLALELISEPTLLVCLNLQILIRDNELTFLNAVKALESVHQRQLPLESALKEVGVKRVDRLARPRIGELLVAAGLLCHSDRMIVTELGTEHDVAFGQLLLQYNLLPQVVLEAVVQLQNMFDNPMFTKTRAVRLLKLVASTGSSLERLMDEFDVLEQVVALLRAAGVLDERVVRDTAATIVDFEQSIAEALITRGVLVPELSRAGIECLRKIELGEISYERALEILLSYKPNYRQPAQDAELDNSRDRGYCVDESAKAADDPDLVAA
jgi:hypothetical protein